MTRGRVIAVNRHDLAATIVVVSDVGWIGHRGRQPSGMYWPVPTE